MVKALISPFPKRIKKAGLNHSELIYLKKLWESANKEQKQYIYNHHLILNERDNNGK